ncbi:hypothetical protein PHLGIDRAFT_126432 [Phlebiopsis gigantea 11061_1 CR5-6]|uniref:HD domain-containing protein n=1 Tax=Phlebiopsis gigantea (strain 11061_1 CR5-6) TaxID=745531 RepID=A0A0C3S248_PHLG1|nr:hypothetical protein PHLGIDRAFT_126432 [Phlebiopsis gigantea 11061_1 CR5-6]
MGSASSKAARQLPKTATKPVWAGARTPGSGQPAAHAPPTPSRALPAAASDTRTEAIEQDAGDPDFLAKLHTLGAVKAVNHAQHVHAVRLQAEREAGAAQPARNRLLAAALHDVLEERKHARGPADVDRLTRRYEIDADHLDRLARYVTTPAVDPASVQRVLKGDGSEVTTMKAMWTEPSLMK